MAAIVLLLTLLVHQTVSLFHHVDGARVTILERKSLSDNLEHNSMRVKRANLPSPMESLIMDMTSPKLYDFSTLCKFKVSLEGTKVKINVQEDECVQKPSLKQVVNTFFPDVPHEEAPSLVICTDCYFFESLQYDQGTKVVEITASGKETIQLMNPRYFQLDKAKLRVSFDTSDMDLDLTKIDISLEGDVHVKGQSVKMIINKPSKETKFSFSWQIASILLKDLSAHFGVQITELTKPEDRFSTDLYLTISLKNPEIKGVFTLTKKEDSVVPLTLQLVAKADVSNTKAFQHATIYLIVNKKEGVPPTGAVLAEVPPSNSFTADLAKFSQVKWKVEVPLLAKTERNALICVSQEEIEVVEDDALLGMLKSYLKGDETSFISKGVHLKMFIPLKHKMKKCHPPVDLSDVPDDLPVKIFIKAKGIDFQYPDKFKKKMPNILKCWDPTIEAELPYPVPPN